MEKSVLNGVASAVQTPRNDDLVTIYLGFACGALLFGRGDGGKAGSVDAAFL